MQKKGLGTNEDEITDAKDNGSHSGDNTDDVNQIRNIEEH